MLSKRYESTEVDRRTLATRAFYAVKIHEVSLNLQKSWDSIVLQKASDFNIMDIINRNCNTKLQMKFIKEVIFEKDCSDWYLELHNDRHLLNGNKLRTFRENKSFLSASPYVNIVKNRSYRKIYINSTQEKYTLILEVAHCLWLLKQVDLYSKPIIPLEQRLCNFCNENTVEDETHSIIHCDLYLDIRYVWKANGVKILTLQPCSCKFVNQYLWFVVP